MTIAADRQDALERASIDVVHAFGVLATPPDEPAPTKGTKK